MNTKGLSECFFFKGVCTLCNHVKGSVGINQYYKCSWGQGHLGTGLNFPKCLWRAIFDKTRVVESLSGPLNFSMLSREKFLKYLYSHEFKRTYILTNPERLEHITLLFVYITETLSSYYWFNFWLLKNSMNCETSYWRHLYQIKIFKYTIEMMELIAFTHQCQGLS